MDFFARQEQSRRTTRFLVVAFALAFLAVILATTVVAGVVLRLYADTNDPMTAAASWTEWAQQNVGLLATIAAGTFVIIGLASGYRTASLSGGGGQVARMLNATQVTGDGSGDRLRERLVNVVEEMAIASGLPVPEIYILEQEPAINAFASGLTQGDAAITVTRGALERLSRSELQGVVAHEFSHIVNGDMRLNQRLIGLCFGILVLSLVGRWLLRAGAFGGMGGYRGGRRDRSGGINVALAAGLAVTLIGAIGLLASRLIKAAVSRQRESLADASAVQFTRDPSGLAGALKQIGGYTSKMSSVETEEVAHMLFDHGGISQLFATHPPLIERIKAIEPDFDPKAFEAAAATNGATAAAGPEAAQAGLASAFAGAHEASSVRPSVRAEMADESAIAEHASTGNSGINASSVADHLLGQTGEVGSPAVGGALHAALPAALHAAARSREQSVLLVLALALSADDTTRSRQTTLLAQQLGQYLADHCQSLHDDLATLDPKLRIPILELAIPALKQRPAGQITFLFDLVDHLVALESEQSLFDYVLLRMLHVFLTDSPQVPSDTHTPRMSGSAAVSNLLAAVAAFGHTEATAAHAAYLAGLAAAGLDATKLAEPDFQSRAQLRDLTRFDAVLGRLSTIKPENKRAVLKAVLATIHFDRMLDVEEIELYRAIAATLGCPVPPLITLDALPRT